MVQDLLDLVGTLFLDGEWLASLREHIPQGNVEDCSTLGSVDVFSLEHGVSELGDLGLLGEVQKGRPGVLIDQVLGVVDEDLVSVAGGGGLVKTRKGLESLGAFRTVEEVLELERGVLLVVDRLKLLPSGVF